MHIFKWVLNQIKTMSKKAIYLCCRAGSVGSFSPCLSKSANTSLSVTWRTNFFLPNDLSLCSPSSLPFSPFRFGPSIGLASTSSASRTIADTISWQLLGSSSVAIFKPASSRIRSSWTDSSLAWWRLCWMEAAVRSTFTCWIWDRKFSRATRINLIFLRCCLCCSKHKERLWRVCCRWDWSSIWLGSSEPLALWRRLSSLSIFSSRRYKKNKGCVCERVCACKVHQFTQTYIKYQRHFQGKVHPKNVIFNLYTLLCSIKHKGRYLAKCWQLRFLGHNWLP